LFEGEGAAVLVGELGEGIGAAAAQWVGPCGECAGVELAA
jgi:hypothetical protein